MVYIADIDADIAPGYIVMGACVIVIMLFPGWDLLYVMAWVVLLYLVYLKYLTLKKSGAGGLL